MDEFEQILNCGEVFAARIKEKLYVNTPEQLYAKYISVQKDNKLFAEALHIEEDEVRQMMAALRDAIAPERVERLERELPLDQMGLGARIDRPEMNESKWKAMKMRVIERFCKMAGQLKMKKETAENPEARQGVDDQINNNNQN